MTAANHIGYFAHLVDLGKMTEEEAHKQLREMHESDMQQDKFDREMIELIKKANQEENVVTIPSGSILTKEQTEAIYEFANNLIVSNVITDILKRPKFEIAITDENADVITSANFKSQEDIPIEALKELEANDTNMIKFWLDDFEYIKRLGSTEPFGYLFKVRSESAGYLMNKYQLNYSNVFVNCYVDKTIYIGSRSENGLRGEVCDCDEDDIDELYNLLKPIIKIDMVNYEEYLADSCFFPKDDRWE